MKMFVLIALFSVISITGCETMEGLGRDIQNLGDAIEDEAPDND
jgi:predicted small secreted protein